ncbi:prepilin peptidase [Gulbenkiania mobilis]|uniref:prepilin peptidase n=1 Tax=Gulbenkiania mobilis TaxID=397457 RepID=UPI0006BBE458|nr:A24 family peptidase [Gulbenkiania mobilis]
MAELHALLSANPSVFVVLALMLGLVIGSFLNVVIHRVPRMLEAHWRMECAAYGMGDAPASGAAYSLWTPRSACPACGSAIRPWHNIPLAGFAVLRGRCAACRAPISWRYPMVEALTGGLFALLAYHYGAGIAFVGYAAFTAFLIALAFIDADTHLLPDNLTLPLLWLGLAFNLYTGRVPLEDAVLGAMLGYGLLWSVYWAFRLATGKEGMGYGDFKLLAALGAWLGWVQVPLIILLSSVVGAVFGVALILMARHGRGQPLPFGPYLAVAGWVALLWGAPFLAWYLHG